MKNKQVIIFIIGGIIIASLLIYKYIENKDNKKVSITSNLPANQVDNLPVPKVQNYTDTITDKETLYNLKNNRIADEENSKIEKKQTIEEIAKIMKEQQNKKNAKIEAENLNNTSQNSLPVVPPQTNQSLNTNYSKKRTKKVVNDDELSNNRNSKENKAASKIIINRGIVSTNGLSGNNTESQSASKNNNTIDNNYSQAIFEEDTKIYNTKRVIIKLIDNARFNGKEFRKGSYCYATVSESGTIFDIKIHSIKSMDGNTYPVKNLIIYDENYSRGIVNDNKVNQAVKEGAEETAYETTDNTVGSAGGTNTLINIAGKAISNTTRAVSNKRQNSIELRMGYKMYIKEIEQ